MINLTSEHAVGIRDGMKMSLLIPSSRFSSFALREIHCVQVEELIIGYVCLTKIVTGSIKHWSHEKATLSEYGCAQPHELIDRLKKFYPHHRFRSEDEPWIKISFVPVDNWQDHDPEKIGNALWSLKFRIKMGAA